MNSAKGDPAETIFTNNKSSTNDFDINTMKITDIMDIKFLQDYQDDFANGFGIASVTVDLQGNPVTNSKYITQNNKPQLHPRLSSPLLFEKTEWV